MQIAAQSVNIVIEHVTGISDYTEEGYEDCWLVVAYLNIDRGQWQRATLHRASSLAEASAALQTVWSGITTERTQQSRAA